MIEVKNKSIATIVLKLVQKKKKNLFEIDLHEAVERIKGNTVFFDDLEIKPIVSNWLMLNSDKQQEALKTNPHLKKFQKNIIESFAEFDTTPDEFFTTIHNTYKK
tara:strand:- start:12559 stop:12873 length:315 start_codon:yes stop_codon:yes gene_type:complete